MSYEEKRVRVKAFGSLPKGSKLLVEVPGVGGKARHLHVLAAKGFEALAQAMQKELQLELRIASGWRPHKWKSRQEYEQIVKAKYGTVQEGQKWLAYSSPHETGLAMDIGVGGLTPNRKTRDQQRKTPLHQWLVANAYRFGWHPYKQEPWHWEFPISKSAWTTGQPDDAPAAISAATSDDVQATEDELEHPE